MVVYDKFRYKYAVFGVALQPNALRGASIAGRVVRGAATYAFSKDINNKKILIQIYAC